jgi:hypothetical protein
MKKIKFLIAVIFCTGFMSCKKSYTCDCTTTVTFAGQDPHESKASEPIGQKTSNAQAVAICKATEAELNAQFKQQLADPNVSSTSSAECAVK